METPLKQNMRRPRNWIIPASVLLHVVLIGALYFYGDYEASMPVEPESVSVELVDPPKEEPPPPPEEKKAEEAKTPEPPPPPPPDNQRAASLPSVAIRPDKTQLDARDEPGEQTDQGGQEQRQPGEGAVPEAQKDEMVAKQEPPATPVAPSPSTPVSSEASAIPANAANGEIAASQNPPVQDQVATVVPVPRPDPKELKPSQADAPASGEGNPELKPAKKILASGKRPKPMLRQIMGKLPPQERVAQLCIAETMAQIRVNKGSFIGLQPHTGKDYPIAGNLMNAKGAFNVGNNTWFAVDYRCEVDIDKYIVTDFRFHIGGQFAPEDVKRLKLPEG